MKNLQKKLAKGNAKLYYEIENEFEAVGTFFTDWNMYYIAAHPKGLWLSGITLDNTLVPIGLVPWDNILKMIIDSKNAMIYIVVKDFDSILSNADWQVRKIYKNSFLHKMLDTGEMSICLEEDLFSGNILPYLKNKIPTEEKEVELSTTEKWGKIIGTILVIIFFLFCILRFIGIV